MSNLVPINDWSIRGAVEKQDPIDDEMERDIVLAVSGLEQQQNTAKTSAPPANPLVRDWASAVLLVQEAAEAIRMSKEREKELEVEANDQLKQHHVDLTALHTELLRARKEIEAANERARAAERLLAESTEWLNKLADSITTNFATLSRSS